MYIDLNINPGQNDDKQINSNVKSILDFQF